MEKIKDSEKLLEAVALRHSVRRYEDKPLSTDIVELLKDRIDFLNHEGRLHMQLVLEEPKGFNGFFAYGQFSGVRNYIVVAGEKDETLDDRIGYYGEQLVLYAQALGLNTCWAGLSYKKVPGTYELRENEKIGCYIAIGYGQTQGTTHKIKTVEQVSNAGPDTPDWFLRGVECALLAPTAVNQQKFSFEYVASNAAEVLPTVIARRGHSLVGYTRMDLGIARLHFALATADAQYNLQIQ